MTILCSLAVQGMSLEVHVVEHMELQLIHHMYYRQEGHVLHILLGQANEHIS